MYKIACTRKEASCILGNFFGELRPACAECRARPDDKLALKTESGLTLEGEAVLTIEGHSSVTEIARIRNARCLYIGRAVNPTEEG